MKVLKVTKEVSFYVETDDPDFGGIYRRSGEAEKRRSGEGRWEQRFGASREPLEPVRDDEEIEAAFQEWTRLNPGQGYTDGGRNPLYEGLFAGETEADKDRRIRWAIHVDQLPWPGMMSSFEKYYSQSWFDKDWRKETCVWAAAWKARTLLGDDK